MHPIRNRKFQSIMIIYNRVVCHKVRSLKVPCKDTINIPNCQTFRGIFQGNERARKSPDYITTAEAKPYLYYNHNDYQILHFYLLKATEPLSKKVTLKP